MFMKVKCPKCRKEGVWEGNRWKPFCSERCKMLDLGSWASERFSIPGASSGEPSIDLEFDDDLVGFEDPTETKH